MKPIDMTESHVGVLSQLRSAANSKDMRDLDMAAGLVIVGASLAGLRAAQAVRREGYGGPVTLIGDEPHLPYDRPPLSKAYLADDAEPDYFVTPEELMADGIELRLSTRVTALDPKSRQIVVGEERIDYDVLVIATGASARLIPSVGNLHGVVTLRTLDDAIAIRGELGRVKDVVVIGAGFIGSEMASAAKSRGARVTILEAAPVPLVRAVGERVGEAISGLHARHGVRLICGASVDEIRGVNGRVTEVSMVGGERIPADLVIVGIGATPATGWLESSGILLCAVDGGVVCDEYLQTSIPGVYAAGDVAHWPNAAMGISMRLENWTSAAEQGARAGLNAVLGHDEQLRFETVPYFWSDWYGHRIQFVGSAIAGTVEFVTGGPDEEKFVALYRKDNRLVGAATLNERRRIMKLRRIIQDGGEWDAAIELLSPREQAPSGV